MAEDPRGLSGTSPNAGLSGTNPAQGLPPHPVAGWMPPETPFVPAGPPSDGPFPDGGSPGGLPVAGQPQDPYGYPASFVSGYPPPPGAAQNVGGFPPGGYYPPPPYPPGGLPTPPAAPGRRWPIVVVVVVALIVAMSGVGLTWAMVRMSASDTHPSPTVSAPSSPSKGATANAQSAPVTAAQSRGVVLIETQTAEGTASGTGMILSADGKVLTNYHVVAGTTAVMVTVADSGDTFPAKVLGFDQSRDVALLQLKDAHGLPTVKTDDDPVAVGDRVAAVGNASGGRKLTKAPGEVFATDQSLRVNSDSPWGNTEDLNGLIGTNAGAVPGDSGGPMFDAEDEVLGMTTAGSTDDHTSYAVPIAQALSVVRTIEAGRDSGSVRVGPAGFLGVSVPETEVTNKGAKVTTVSSGSPAAKAGITTGSRITRVGDTKIVARINVANVIRATEPGSKVKIWWTSPSGKAKSATVTMGSSPVN